MSCKVVNGGIGNPEQCFLVPDNRKQVFAAEDSVAEQSAEGNDVTRFPGPGICRTGLHASAAVVAQRFLLGDFFLFTEGEGAFTADLGAYLAVDAFFPVKGDNQATLDAEVVLFGLKTVVYAAGNSELEFMRKLSAEISFTEFLSQGGCVDTSARTCARIRW